MINPNIDPSRKLVSKNNPLYVVDSLYSKVSNIKLGAEVGYLVREESSQQMDCISYDPKVSTHEINQCFYNTILKGDKVYCMILFEAISNQNSFNKQYFNNQIISSQANSYTSFLPANLPNITNLTPVLGINIPSLLVNNQKEKIFKIVQDGIEIALLRTDKSNNIIETEEDISQVMDENKCTIYMIAIGESKILEETFNYFKTQFKFRSKNAYSYTKILQNKNAFVAIAENNFHQSIPNVLEIYCQNDQPMATVIYEPHNYIKSVHATYNPLVRYDKTKITINTRYAYAFFSYLNLKFDLYELNVNNISGSNIDYMQEFSFSFGEKTPINKSICYDVMIYDNSANSFVVSVAHDPITTDIDPGKIIGTNLKIHGINYLVEKINTTDFSSPRIYLRKVL